MRTWTPREPDAPRGDEGRARLILVDSARALPRWTTIGCAIDLSEASLRAAERGAALARQLEAELVLIHVCAPPLVTPDLYVLPEHGDAYRDDILRERERHARACCERIASLTGGRVRVDVVVAETPHDVAALAQRRRFDVLVVGSRERTGIHRLLFGSVADSVARSARVPVLVIPQRRWCGGPARSPSAPPSTGASHAS